MAWDNDDFPKIWADLLTTEELDFLLGLLNQSEKFTNPNPAYR
ncbi:hypothetical protein [Heliobacterium chlorum]|nr:hypothetical protein [Heliobacterium chlorum]